MYKNINLIILISFILSINPLDSNFAQWKRIDSPEIKTPISTYTIASWGDTLLVGTYNGTIYRSTNNGLSWLKSDAGIPFLYWTYDFYLAGDVIYSMGEEGIFRSTNMGKAWVVKNSGLHSGAWKYVYSMLQIDNILFAATDFGIYKSSNNGDYWYPSNGDSAFWPIYSLASLNSLMFAGSGDGVFRSTDKGITWNTANNGIPSFSSGHIPRINKLFIDGENIYAGTNGMGIYISSNYGNTWLPDTIGLKKWVNGFFPPTYAIAKIGNYIFVGTQEDGIYYQGSIGSPWIQVNTGLPENSYVTSIISQNDKIFSATNNGLYYSLMNNIAWLPLFTELPGIVNTGVVGSSGNNLFISASSNYYNGTITGIFYSSDIGSTWIRDSVLSKNYIHSFQSYSDSLYAIGRGLFFSFNNGNNWIQIDSNLTGNLIKNNDTLFVGWGYDNWQFGERGGILLSSNNGKSWSEIWQADTAVYAIAKIKNNLFSGGLHGVFRSTNTGSSWTTVNTGLPSIITVESLNTIEKNLFITSDRGIYLSTTNGDAWFTANNGLPIDTLNYNSIHLLINNNYLYVGTKNGIYFSINLGEMWTPVSNGLSGDALSIKSLTVHGNDLIIATDDGLWRRSLLEINSSENNNDNFPKVYYLSQNYPNPFNPLTNINYAVPKTSFVTIKVYDLLGREVKILVNEEKAMGNYKIKFSSTGLANGVYFYRMQADNFVETKKFILLK